MSDNDERDPHGEPVFPQDPLGSFDAFRARRAQERAENEPFPEQYESEPTAVLPPAADDPVLRSRREESPYNAAFPDDPDFDYAGPEYGGRDAARGGGRLRSVLVLGGVAIVVAVGLMVGIYAATQSPSGQFAASTPTTTPTSGASAVPSASGSAGATQAPKYGKAVIARLTVTSVSADSFDATAADGTSVSVQITPTTKFGTAARPFTRAQLVRGAVVYVRLRRGPDGTITATVIAP